MDKSRVKRLVENCRSSSCNKVLEALLVLRNEVTRSRQGVEMLRENGGVEAVAGLLRRQQEPLLDLALSTLGNLCMDLEVSEAVGRLRSTSQVVSIIKGLSNDRLVGRACRLLGNLAQVESNAEQLMEEGAAPVLVTVINNTDKTASVQTLTMAVRAIRLLWANGNHHTDMLSCGAVRAVSVLLCAECEAAGLVGDGERKHVRRDKSKEILFKGILKCLGCFSAVSTQHECAEQILGEGAGFRCLVMLCKEYRDLASQCLVNLCYVAACRPILGTAGAVECLVDLNTAQADYPERYLNALCLMCREAVNRAKLRECGGLSILLDAVKDTTHLSRHTTALRTLLQFVFDDTSFQMLINEGLIGVIEEQLRDYVATMRCEHQVKGGEGAKVNEEETEDGNKIVIERDNMMIGFNDSYNISDEEEANVEGTQCVTQGRKRTRKGTDDKNTSHIQKMAKYDWGSSGITVSNVSPSSGYSPTGSTSRSPDNRGHISHVYARTTSRLEGDRSPDYMSGCSYYSGGYWSPGSPGSSSACFSSPRDEESSDSEKSERYSPVCSDVEDDDGNNGGDENVTGEMDDLTIDDDTHSVKELQLEEISCHQSKTHRVQCMLILLSRASHSDFGIEHLASPTLLDALLSYVGNTRNPGNRAARILVRIISYATHIIKILKHRLVLQLYRLDLSPKHTKCKQCRQLKVISKRLMVHLTMLVESDYGIGEISYQLQKGEPNIKQSLALTLPYITKAHKPLKKFLINCKAFDLFFTMMSGGRETLEHLVPSLSQLARSLHLKDPKSLEFSFQEQSLAQYNFQTKNLQPEDVVSFSLDDSTCVQADKQFLCQQSDVFNAMLTGAFKESQESTVNMKNVSRGSLEYLLSLLHCGANNGDAHLTTFPLCEDLHTCLQTLLLADRFLMEKLKGSLFSAIIQFKLQWQTASEVYVWSLEEGMGLLCVEAAAYILTGDMSDAHRHQVISSIMETPYRQQLMEDFKSLLVRHFK